MKRLSPKEEVIMNLLWKHGPLFVKEMLNFYDDPKPHFNTVSTFVRQLEEEGFQCDRTHSSQKSLLRCPKS